MIDPCNCTNFDRNDHELEEFLTFCIGVANKPADQIAVKVRRLVRDRGTWETPFSYFKRLGRTLRQRLEEVRFSPYSHKETALRGVMELDIRKCSKEDLMAVPYIGPKTARYFLLHSRPNQELAVIDTHHLRLMQWHGVTDMKKVPTQEGPYSRLEAIHQKLRRKLAPNHSAADFDLLVWRAMSGRLDLVPGWLIPRRL